jgi:hypothetical protein
MTRNRSYGRHQYGMFGVISQTDLSRRRSESGRLYSQATLSQSTFRIYKCYIIIYNKLPWFVYEQAKKMKTLRNKWQYHSEITPSSNHRAYIHVWIKHSGCAWIWRFPLLRFRSALHCGYSGITDIQNGLCFVLTRARTFKKS